MNGRVVAARAIARGRDEQFIERRIVDRRDTTREDSPLVAAEHAIIVDSTGMAIDDVFAKMMMFITLFIWIRFTVPRLRYDQLMSFGWKVLLPLATLNVLVTAIIVGT